MGFNFGAFAAGAVKGAGDLMEKQNKETKDTIDSNMKFAYQSGLPFVRERQKRLRSLTGQANDLANLGLTPDEVNAVMGQSDKQIQEFIDGSIKEKKMNTEFDPASQINMQEGGTITPWQDVQMGTIDTPSLNTPKPVARKSLLSSLMGSDDSGSDDGFERLRGKAEQEMSSITGVSYKDVIAASQGAYNYGERSDATINLVDSSLSASARMQQINLEVAEKIALKGADAQLLAYKRAETDGQRKDERYKIEEKINQIDLMTLQFKIDNNMPQQELENELSEIRKAQADYDFGTDSYDGIFITARAIMIEELKDNPNQEKLKSLYATRSFLHQTIAEQSALKKDSSAEISFPQYKAIFDEEAKRIVKDYVGENEYFTYSDGVATFDYTKMNAQAYEKYARQQAASNWITNMRETGQPVSQQMTNWMGLNQKMFGGSAQDLATLPAYDANNVDPKQRYVFVVDAPSGIDGAKKVRTASGKVVWNVPAAGEIGEIQVPVVKAYRVATGEKITQALADAKVKASNEVEADALQVKKDSDEQALSAQEQYREIPYKKPTEETLFERRTREREEKQAARIAALPPAISEEQQEYLDLSESNLSSASNDERKDIMEIMGMVSTAKGKNMTVEDRKEALEILSTKGITWQQIKFGTEELAKLTQLEES
jgi:hypothetical protein